MMNKIFNLRRFSKVLVKDLKEYYSKYGLSIFVFVGCYFGWWLICTIIDEGVTMNERANFMHFIAIICIIIAPFKLYGDVNKQKEGVSFAILPTSSLEKLVSMMINCIVVTPILIYGLTYITDLVLSLLPFGEFSGSLQFEFNHTEKYLLGMVFFSSIFTFGNVLFQKRKASKTILSVMFFAFLFITIYGKIVVKHYLSPGELELYLDSYKAIKVNSSSINMLGPSYERFIQVTKNIFYVVLYTVPVLMYIGTFLKIKTQKY